MMEVYEIGKCVGRNGNFLFRDGEFDFRTHVIAANVELRLCSEHDTRSYRETFYKTSDTSWVIKRRCRHGYGEGILCPTEYLLVITEQNQDDGLFYIKEMKTDRDEIIAWINENSDPIFTDLPIAKICDLNENVSYRFDRQVIDGITYDQLILFDEEHKGYLVGPVLTLARQGEEGTTSRFIIWMDCELPEWQQNDGFIDCRYKQINQYDLRARLYRALKHDPQRFEELVYDAEVAGWGWYDYYLYHQDEYRKDLSSARLQEEQNA